MRKGRDMVCTHSLAMLQQMVDYANLIRASAPAFIGLRKPIELSTVH